MSESVPLLSETAINAKNTKEQAKTSAKWNKTAFFGMLIVLFIIVLVVSILHVVLYALKQLDNYGEGFTQGALMLSGLIGLVFIAGFYNNVIEITNLTQ